MLRAKKRRLSSEVARLCGDTKRREVLDPAPTEVNSKALIDFSGAEFGPR